MACVRKGQKNKYVGSKVKIGPATYHIIGCFKMPKTGETRYRARNISTGEHVTLRRSSVSAAAGRGGVVKGARYRPRAPKRARNELGQFV
jgi:hypothetical protein